MILRSQTFFYRFPGIVINNTTFEEFDEICEQIHRQ